MARCSNRDAVVGVYLVAARAARRRRWIVESERVIELNEDLRMLASAGYGQARLIASGMEGSVYQLADSTVGKIPHERVPVDPQGILLAEALGRESLPIAVPRPLGSVVLEDGRIMRLERLLPGRTLDDFRESARDTLDPRVVRALGDVLESLRGLMIDVPDRAILDGERYRASVERWSDELVDLGRRRFARFGGQLIARDPTAPRTVSNLLSFVASRRGVSPSLAHGDICGANVLVDDDCRPTALIDWGFFSVLAEPALDIAITAATLEMYGPSAIEVDGTLTDYFCERFEVERDILLAYKGYYALVTSNVYSPDGTDGHFAWCSAMLARADVRRAAATLAGRADVRIEVA